MIKYIVAGILSVVFSLITERLSQGVLKDEKLNLKAKPNIKMLLLLLALNIAVWGSVIFLNPSAFYLNLILCVGFDILVIIAISDCYTKTFSNIFLIILFVLAAVYTVFDTSCPLYMHLLGCAFGYLLLFAFYFISKKVLKQETLGMGDVYLSGIIGLFFGLRNYLFCGMISCLVGLICVNIIRRKKKYDKMHLYPFSPFFAIGYALTAIFCNWFFDWYFSIIISTTLFR